MIVDLYSKRAVGTVTEEIDAFVYDAIPKELRIKIIYLLDDAFGDHECFNDHRTNSGRFCRRVYAIITNALRREYGVFKLSDNAFRNDDFLEAQNFILNEPKVERVLDLVELAFRIIQNPELNLEQLSNDLATELTNELNHRFKEHGIGYSYQSGKIIRKDSEFLHRSATIPALEFLHETKYAGAQEEFLKALEHHRLGKNKEAINECLKSLESLLKIICYEHSWTIPPNATSQALIEAVFSNGLIPSYWKSHFNTLKSLLRDGVPTGRNKTSGHGQGTAPIQVSENIVAYILHMTASSIVFLAEQSRQLKLETVGKVAK